MLVYDICFSCDNAYCEQLAVAIASIIENSESDEAFNFYILDGGISEYNKSRFLKLKKIKDFNITFIGVDYDEFIDCPMLKDKNSAYSNYHVTKPTYFRYKISSFLPELDKVLYMDCDIIALSSLKELYTLNLNDNYVAMTRDIDNEKESKRLSLSAYFNAGVMLINLKKWRECNIEQELFKFTKQNEDTLLWQDQDVFNLVFKEKILDLENIWNFQIDHTLHSDVLNEEYQTIKILHFSGRHKPSLLNYNGCPAFELYYAYLIRIAWLDNMYNCKYKQISYILEKEIYKGKIAQETRKIYDEIHALNKKYFTEQKKIYEFVENKYKDLLAISEIKTAETDEKYFTEQRKVYEFIDSKCKDLLAISEIKTAETDEKYFAEQRKVYEFIDSKCKDLMAVSEIKTAETDEKYFAEQKKVYEFIDSKCKDLMAVSEIKTAETDEKYFTEQKKVYEFIDSKCKDLLAILEIQAAETDEKYFTEQKKVYEFIDSKYQDLLNISNIKFSRQDQIYYEEQHKIYQYINNKFESVIKQNEDRIKQYEHDLNILKQAFNEIKEKVK